ASITTARITKSTKKAKIPKNIIGEPIANATSGVPPFEPTIRDGKIFARGVCDNKGEIICRLQAIKAYNKILGITPINIKFLIEGEEEVGSPNLEEFVKKNKKFMSNVDGIIWEFGNRTKEGIQQIYLGVKGILYLHMQTKTIGRDIHSGYTQFVDNAAYELVWSLSQLKNRDDKVLVKGFYDNIPEPTAEEIKEVEDFDLKEEEMKETFGVEQFRGGLTGLDIKRKYFLEPTLNICGVWSGYQGEGSKTVTPNEAFAKVDCRLVPGQDPTDLVEKIRAYLDVLNFQHIEITSWDGYPAAKTKSTTPFAQAIIKTFREVYNHEPIVWPLVGGSGPMYLFENVPCVSIGTGHPDGNAHAPNENLVIEDWIQGMKTIATLIHKF
ncbi:MAG: M20/M25/M40 family metallo-hydrolase, partial [Candidatus Heimdallarchaeota archaeon]|nr:M20/M25/M40 family metallo-hydrolase [Candidatus Heimdallarchaeota archaeon]